MSELLQLSYSGQEFPAYLARPAGKIKGGIIVIHEVWALNDHTKSIADRFAAEGYVALAPDLLTMTDIAQHADTLALDLFNPEKRNEAQPKLRALMAPMREPGFAEATLGKLKVCFDHLYNLPEVGQRVAVNGYCFGGSYSYSLAVHEPRLKAAVPFYGHATDDGDELRRIKCPILAFYGEKDEALVHNLPELKKAMEQAGVDYTAVVYPDCGHAFFNDTNPFAYNEAAATDAWKRTLEFLGAHL
ncbi:MAG TPA: dienelactone hydrolase family protein [Candidatus Saccharimonadales bacterium]